MSSFDPATVRQAVAEFTPLRPQKFQDLIPAKDVIIELRQRRASYRAIAVLLTQHCLPTSKTAIATFCHQILGEIVRPHRRPGRKRLPSPAEPNGRVASPAQSEPADDRPSQEPPADSNGGGTPQSFARGLNDTPKIAALLLVASALDIRWGLVAVAIAIGAGGMLNARRVAETMSHKITGMNAGQGFAANLSTALLVTTASVHGLPVSTTHVSVGSLLGMGIVTGQAKWRPVLGVLASWVITLPCAAFLATTIYFVLRHTIAP